MHRLERLDVLGEVGGLLATRMQLGQFVGNLVTNQGEATAGIAGPDAITGHSTRRC